MKCIRKTIDSTCLTVFFTGYDAAYQARQERSISSHRFSIVVGFLAGLMAKDPSVKKSPPKRSLFIRFLSPLIDFCFKTSNAESSNVFLAKDRFALEADFNDIYFDAIAKTF